MGRARSEPQANEGRQGGFAGRSPARLVGVVGFEPTTLTPQRSSHLSKLGHLQIRTTAQSREEPQIPANLLQVVRLVGCGPGGRNRVVPGAPLFPQRPRLLAPRVGGLMSRHRLGTSAKADLQNPGQWESPEATSERLLSRLQPHALERPGAPVIDDSGAFGSTREEAFGQFRRHGNCRGGIRDDDLDPVRPTARLHRCFTKIGESREQAR
jgi:hypothetical protein